MNNTKKIIIACGGTGGHLYPGLALARELKKRKSDPVFIVRKNDAGIRVLSAEGFDYYEIPVIGMPRSLSLKLFSFVFLLIKGFFAALKLMNKVKPEIIAGMGGYVSFPVVLAARLKGIRAVIHEQNYIPGFANKMLFKLANKVAVSFGDSTEYFPKNKTIVTGNPVRAELFESVSEDAYSEFGFTKDRFTVFVFGGSQGASRLNSVMVDSLEYLADVKDKMQFIHLAGGSDVQWVKDEYSNSGFKAHVVSYLDSMGKAYSAADLIISRAGATTVAELKILNKPAILIPFPYATANHQEYNALSLVKSFQAVLIKEKDLTTKVLAEGIRFQLRSFPKQYHMKMPSPLPQEKLADLVLGI